MGLYIKTNSKGEPVPLRGKADFLIADGAMEVNGLLFVPHMICVVANPEFEAARFMFNRQEYHRCRFDGTDRPKRWLSYPIGTKAWEEKYPELLVDDDPSMSDMDTMIETLSKVLKEPDAGRGDTPGFTIIRLD